jgi:hydroxymethylpyrimidine/phosphomethylpyrimidine kinase
MIAMSMAGFDPSGGAGILNDVKTFSAFGVYGTAVITAITAQNIKKVEGIQPVDQEFIEKQIDTVLEQEKIEFAKTGMLYSPEIIETVASKVSEHQLKKYLLPVAILTTPNIYEAQEISGIKIETTEDSIEAALKIGELCDVVVTGGHLDGTDVLFDGSIKVIEGELVESNNIHGSGCTYSSAIVASLVNGDNIENAAKQAREFVRESIKHGSRGTLNQFWKTG